MKLLRGGESVIAFGFQAGVARRTSEEFQKGASNAAIGQTNGTLVLGDKRERLGDRAGISFGGTGDLADGVGEDFGVEAAERVRSEIRRGFGAEGAGNGRELVSLRIKDQAIEGLQVIVRRD